MRTKILPPFSKMDLGWKSGERCSNPSQTTEYSSLHFCISCNLIAKETQCRHKPETASSPLGTYLNLNNCSLCFLDLCLSLNSFCHKTLPWVLSLAGPSRTLQNLVSLSLSPPLRLNGTAWIPAICLSLFACPYFTVTFHSYFHALLTGNGGGNRLGIFPGWVCRFFLRRRRACRERFLAILTGH